MKLNTPEGLKDAEPLDFILETPEPSFKVLMADGGAALCRTTVTAVFAWQSNDGTKQYCVNSVTSVVKIADGA